MDTPDSEPREFLLFPQLAPELRLKIWTHVLFSSLRIVELCQLQDAKHISPHPGFDANSEEPENSIYQTINTAPFYSPTAIPVLLQAVNKESRAVALEHYTLSFPNIKSTPPHPARIWFCPDLDVLYFPSWCFGMSLDHFEQGVPDSEKAKIKRLARDNLVWWAPEWRDGTINNEITVSQISGLEELVYVQRDTTHMGCACCAEYEGPEKGVVGLTWDVVVNKWNLRCKKEAEEALEVIGKTKLENGEPWSWPKISFAVLMRDGKYA